MRKLKAKVNDKIKSYCKLQYDLIKIHLKVSFLKNYKTLFYFLKKDGIINTKKESNSNLPIIIFNDRKYFPKTEMLL